MTFGVRSRIVLMLLFGVLSTSCGDDVATAALGEFEGTWRSTCEVESGGSEYGIWVITASEAKLTEYNYSTADCSGTQTSTQIDFNGAFTIVGESTDVTGAKKVNVIQPSGSVKYTLMKVVGNSLTVGKSDGTHLGTSEAQRNVVMDTLVFTRQ